MVYNMEQSPHKIRLVRVQKVRVMKCRKDSVKLYYRMNRSCVARKLPYIRASGESSRQVYCLHLKPSPLPRRNTLPPIVYTH